MKCHRTGRSVYAMDHPVKIDTGGGTLVFSRGSFTCATCNASMTLSNYTLHNGEVYHKTHVPDGSTHTATVAAPPPAAASAGGNSEQRIQANAPLAHPTPQAPTVTTVVPPADGGPSHSRTTVPVAAPTPVDGPTTPPTTVHLAGGSPRVLRTTLPSKTANPASAVHRPKGTAENLAKFQDIQSKTADEQSRFFLMAFVVEFTGRSDAILEKAEGFKRSLEPNASSLSEVDSHRLLEEMGRAQTYNEMREVMREIDQDSDGRVSLIEWLLFEMDKTLDQLYETKCPPELQDTMQAAIDAWRQVQAGKAAAKSEAIELEGLVAQGGVKGARAALRLAQIKQLGVQSSDVEADVRADRQKKRAEKMVADHTKDATAAEEARVEEAKRQDEESHRAMRNRGRASLAAIAAKFGQASEA
eukprot:m.163635 g.163635  ORF g.163635 m.163635 type:complete len:415 (-) comp23918_c0_seq1:55-1299(-)